MRFWLIILLAFGATGASAQALQNPNFTTDIYGWRFFLDQGAGGLIDWDGAAGAPVAGSARIGNVFVGTRSDALGQCLTPAPSGLRVLRAQVRVDVATGNRCRLRAVYTDLLDCAVGSTALLEANAYADLNSGAFQPLSIALAAPLGARSLAIILSHERADAAAPGTSDCRFDSVELLPDSVMQAGFDS